MKGLHVKLEADNLAVAEIINASLAAVHIKIDGEDRWDAEGLLRLSAMLKGVAATLVASAALGLLVTVADAVGWAEWMPGPAQAQAEYHQIP